jgi:hypothetical protein
MGARDRSARGADPARRLRPLNEPRPLRVETDPAGIPLVVVLGGRRRNVAGIQESWRIDDEWWRSPLSRVYHQVALEDGRTVVLYRDRVEGGWWLQG